MQTGIDRAWAELSSHINPIFGRKDRMSVLRGQASRLKEYSQSHGVDVRSLCTMFIIMHAEITKAKPWENVKNSYRRFDKAGEVWMLFAALCHEMDIMQND